MVVDEDVDEELAVSPIEVTEAVGMRWLEVLIAVTEEMLDIVEAGGPFGPAPRLRELLCIVNPRDAELELVPDGVLDKLFEGAEVVKLVEVGKPKIGPPVEPLPLLELRMSDALVDTANKPQVTSSREVKDKDDAVSVFVVSEDELVALTTVVVDGGIGLPAEVKEQLIGMEEVLIINIVPPLVVDSGSRPPVTLELPAKVVDVWMLALLETPAELVDSAIGPPVTLEELVALNVDVLAPLELTGPDAEVDAKAVEGPDELDVGNEFGPEVDVDSPLGVLEVGTGDGLPVWFRLEVEIVVKPVIGFLEMLELEREVPEALKVELGLGPSDAFELAIDGDLVVEPRERIALGVDVEPGFGPPALLEVVEVVVKVLLADEFWRLLVAVVDAGTEVSPVAVVVERLVEVNLVPVWPLPRPYVVLERSVDVTMILLVISRSCE
ncbi:hypothetical protein G647_06968 [Cladophialophora carrionii CBS 160.54]|uniref:Uncharacterized protein n=1 Tax=Cladophialophora carrionii CBS 160.54 TaxID=1279043 RepID=V9D1U8_9EURO|nr:uncharacterized protein G647_06968 [Cladophialophora carrionii CBS 160.54]ETI20626.1 hypothetical protein G647_06968 [Cladophialophora carrionii CBS 160.54]